MNNAREKFSGYEWVKYNIFDINKDIMEQTIAPFSVDIILAANVLHNAKNIHYVLENLKKITETKWNYYYFRGNLRSIYFININGV